MQVIGPMNPRTAESFPIAGELYGWCSAVTADDLAPGSVGRGIFDAEASRRHPRRHRGAHHPPVPRAGVDTTIAATRQHRRALRGAPRAVRSGARGPRRSCRPPSTRSSASGPRCTAWGRFVTRDVEIDGAVVPAGSQVAILFGAGNRDPRHYENPDAFLVERNPVDHLSFGYGPHGCAGQGLARLEAHAVIDALVRKARRLAVGDELRVPSVSPSG